MHLQPVFGGCETVGGGVASAWSSVQIDIGEVKWLSPLAILRGRGRFVCGVAATWQGVV